jgi:hypothetical protein
MKKQQTASKLINEAKMIGAPTLTHFLQTLHQWKRPDVSVNNM